ncbi:MAG: RNase H-like domain-containing protein [Sedimenticola sp.]
MPPQTERSTVDHPRSVDENPPAPKVRGSERGVGTDTGCDPKTEDARRDERGAATNDVSDPDNTPTVCQLSSLSKFKVQVGVGGLKVDAVVDTAAEVTIISTEVYTAMKHPPQRVRDVTLLTAGKEQSMKGYIVGPCNLKIGSHRYKEFVYVAPITQDMLLGFDFLYSHGAVLDMRQASLLINEETIPLNVDMSKRNPLVARVTVAKRQVVPPNSVMKVSCYLNREMSEYMIESENNTKVLVPKTVYSGTRQPAVCVMNITDKYRVLKKGDQIAKAFPTDGVIEPIPDDETRSVFNTEYQHPDGPPDETKGIPKHLEGAIESSKQHLTEAQQRSFARLLYDYQDVFATDEFDLGDFTEITHSIDTAAARPIKQRMRRTPACFVQEEEAHLKKMLEAGVIQESNSEWASAPVLIRKRDGSVRWCIDYRALNNVTTKDVFPLPLVDDCLDTLAGNQWFSKLDGNSAYWQVKLEDKDRHKTAFITKYGLFEHVKMGFGLCNAPATYARAMNLVLRGLCWKTVLAFLDDILVLGRTFEQHMHNLTDVLHRFRKFRLKLKPTKCLFFRHEVEFLGRVVNGDSLSMTRSDIKVVEEWPIPTCAKDVQRFLGLANYHRSFVKDFANIAEPLFRVVGKNGFQWGEEQQGAFNALKHALTHPPVLALPNQTDEFIIDTDASNLAIGAELIQVQDGVEKVIAYGSYALTPEQRRYCVTRKELLAVLRFCRQYRYYILGRPFVLRTDHASLTWLLNFREPQGQLARWMEELSQYNMILRHREGRKHTNADALSRLITNETPCDTFSPAVKPEKLPCGGCKYCKRAYDNWGSFVEEVDNAVPLVSMVDTSLQMAEETSSGSEETVKYESPGEPSEGRTLRPPEGVASSHLEGPSIGRPEGRAICSPEVRTHSQEVRTLSPQEGLPSWRLEGKVPCLPEVGILHPQEVPLSQRQDGSQEEVRKTVQNTEESAEVMRATYRRQVQLRHQTLAPGEHCGLEEEVHSRKSAPDEHGSPSDTEEHEALLQKPWDVGGSSDEPLIMPWEEGGCRMAGEPVVHVDCSLRDGKITILECGLGPEVAAVEIEQDLPSCWGFSLEELQEEQLKDDSLKWLIRWLKDDTVPSTNELFAASPAIKYYWLNKETFKLADGVLHMMPKESSDRLLVVPTSLREKVLELNHDIPLAGHQGIARTKSKVKEKFFWHGLSDSVHYYVTTCSACSANKKSDRYGKFPMTEFHAGAPMERVHIDFLGPLPKTPRGNEHILMMVDQFTKWVECIPLPSQVAEVTARAAVNEFFARFGMPFQLHSDQGRNFESKLFTAVCKALHIHKTRTTPYRPSSNGQVERYNRTLMDAVRCFIGKSQNQWDVELPQIAGAIRASVNRSTGFTANKLMLGREVNMPAHLLFPPSRRDPPDEDPGSYAAGLVHSLHQAHDTARTTLKTSLRRMKRNYDLRILQRTYEEGDVVHLLDTAVVKGKSKKLSPPWKGPGIIVKKISACIYRVKLKNSVFTTNHDRLKPCRDRVLPVWIRKWKERDREEDVGEADDKLYCSCKKPWEGRFMIMCEYCDEWFHGSCVNVTASDALNIDKYRCAGCARGRPTSD